MASNKQIEEDKWLRESFKEEKVEGKDGLVIKAEEAETGKALYRTMY